MKFAFPYKLLKNLLIDVGSLTLTVKHL